MQIKIDNEFKSLIPKIGDEERRQLEVNLNKDGCREPLAVWAGKNILLDGHNRLEICKQSNLEFDTIEIPLPDRNAAMEWIILNQFGRRNLSAFARAELALRLKSIIAEKAKERQALGGEKKVVQNSAQAGKTRDNLASIAGVSHDTIAKTEKLLAKSDAVTLSDLRSGKTSINAEYKRSIVHVGQNSGENEWYTPPKIIEAVRLALGSIDCDPASSDIANKTVKAKKFYDAKNDGLKHKWFGNVFMNPPYSQPLVSKFSETIVAHIKSGKVKNACVLVNNATETEWCQRMLSVATAVCFLKGRVKFLDRNGKATGAPLQGQVVIYFGDERKKFISSFSGMGIILCR